MPIGAETKNRTFVQQPPAQGSGLILPLPRYRTAAKDVSDPLEGFALRPGCDPEAAISQSRLLLFLGSLLCHLLGGCLRGFLCLLCFLGHVVLFEKWLSEHAHAEYRHAQRRDHITNAELIPTHREVVIESLAGGTRSRAPPSLHAGVAITVPRSGALLTGLATAVGPASRRGPRLRYADAPAAAFFLPAWLAPTNRYLPFVGRLMGSAPRAHQGEAPANAGADPSGIPGLPRFLTSRIFAAGHALVQTRSSSGP